MRIRDRRITAARDEASSQPADGGAVRGALAGRGWLLSLGWLAALALFGFATVATLFITPLAMLGWSLLSAPLAFGTEAFARRTGLRTPAYLSRLEGVLWLAFVVAAVALAGLVLQGRDVPLSDAVAPWVLLVYGLFPVVVTLRALRTLARKPK